MGSGWKETLRRPGRVYSLEKRIYSGRSGCVAAHRPTGVQEHFYPPAQFTGAGRNCLCDCHAAGAVCWDLLAGLKEGSLRDRALSIGGMTFSVIPEFATGIFLILIVAVWLGAGTRRHGFRRKSALGTPGHADFAGAHPNPDRTGLCVAHHPGQHGGGHAIPLHPHGLSERACPTGGSSSSTPSAMP